MQQNPPPMGQPPQEQSFGQQSGGSQPYGTPPPGGAPAPAKPKNNMLAVMGLILGIVSMTIAQGCFIAPLTGIAGIICSAIGMSQIKKDPANQGGKGMAIAGLITSILGFLSFFVVLILLVALGVIDELT